ncbi:UDP-N-acetylglucosamine 2-epimerase [Minicystis rosea]|nr:UDP-N-acetylglucosamine 2-epimerase [Minicystis rosea]
MIALVAGTRPNFMKIAPVQRALVRRGLPVRLIHTGQHFDAAMSAIFFRDLGLPQPDVTLSAGGGSHAQQTAAALVGVEADLLAHRPHLMIVVGDVTSTLAAALSAAKVGIPVAHVESGLRSRDWTMPEEVNRVLTDQLSDLLFIPSHDAAANLIAEGIPRERIVFAGNVMIDSLYDALGRRTDVLARLGQRPRGYAVATLHRPANVDTVEALTVTLDALEVVAARIPVVFPVHPRTVARVEALGLTPRVRALGNLHPITPLGYDDFVTLLSDARLVVTDSGGIQEETTVLGVPCLTLRTSTERPITVSEGTNVVVGMDPHRIAREVDTILAGRAKRGRIPEGWDGRAGERIAESVELFLRGTPPAKRAHQPVPPPESAPWSSEPNAA